MRFYTFISLLLFAQVKAVFWLNQLDSYDSLPYCAEGPISSIVRDMVSGCGDAGRTTSYSCFCTRSSSSFAQIIATAVAKECSHWGTEVSSATSIFHEYCQLGGAGQQTIATTELTTATPSTSTRSASAVTESDNEPTATSSASTSTSNGRLSTTSKIAIGVTTPIGLIGMSVLACLLIRRHRKTKGSNVCAAGLGGRDYTEYKTELDGSNTAVKPPEHKVETPSTQHELSV
ncbi:uncharacterized protein FIESC28_11175 [Fusarium coffeatum]|uniref:Extracellular membrane protein CFEM domain-containing protein n=1 Tax=Fusarium coffeatum TaxID=231269 RepID=A0A366QQF0_9HYPO|nr:uncharacterized protein FIESC28_11175 [Fusarium coffeatum]RBR06160.1 hypothetical protein FIESC28_11175 [Fusarium coffeatum]